MAFVFVLYAGDWIAIHYRIPRGRELFGSVQVKRHYAVKLKDGRTELMFAPPSDVSCTNSLFPQLGMDPCWYLAKHPDQEIKVDGGPTNF